MTDASRVRLPLLRGSAEHADCESCPFSNMGLPSRPVFSEYPEDPMWIIIGEGPGMNETRLGRPFIGMSGQVVNRLLSEIRRPREDLFIGNATLCQPFQGADVQTRERAAQACKPRLMAELAQFPGKPVLTLGAVAARAVIPAEVLAKIDPPETPKALKKAQKFRSQPTFKQQAARRRAISKEAKRRLAKMIEHERRRIITEVKVKFRRRPDEKYLAQEIARVQGKLELKAREDAIKAIDLKAKLRALKQQVDAAKPKKPKKPKPIKITDIVGTLFDVDVDGTGERPLIPGIHPASLLRGGGASIGGSHTPDMAYVNLLFDVSKVDSLAQGKDIRLRVNVEYELADQSRAIELFVQFYHNALEEHANNTRDGIERAAWSLDLETYVDDPDRHHALMAYVARIRVIGLSTKKGTISLAWELLPSWCLSLLQLLLTRTRSAFHNGLYDRTVLMAHGFAISFDDLWDDTLLLHHAAFPGNSHRLQTVTAQFFGVGPWKSEFRNAEETPEKLALYNAQDTGGTHALLKPLHIWLKRKGTERVYELDKKMSAVASHMHLAGMPVHRETNAELLATFSKNVRESRDAVEDKARDPKLREQIWHYLALTQAAKKRKLDPTDFEERYQIRLSAISNDPDWKWKIGSSKHIAALLQAMGVALVKRTEGGEISTQKEVLEELVDQPIVRDILTFRENDKLHSTFVWPTFDRYDDKTGEIQVYGFADAFDRIHPIWNVHRISGRWASQWPVVSNVPKDKWKKLTQDLMAVLLFGVDVPTYREPDKKAGETNEINEFRALAGDVLRVNKDGSFSKQQRPNLRKQIKARPGRMFVGFDFGQIEARVIALISGDPFLCAIFAEGRDPHIECARIIWGHFDQLDPDTRKQLRENVKNIEYGFLYMAQLETLHKTMLKAGNNIKKTDLALAIAKLAKAMSGIPAWQQGSIRKAMQPPYELRDFLLGRMRYWPMAFAGQVEGGEAVNGGVQFAASAIMNEGMARMYPKLLKYRQADPIGQFHDAAIFECWEDDAEAIGRDVKGSFETEIERDGRKIPFPIDLKIGQSWDLV